MKSILHRRMRVFAGCGVGEERSGLLQCKELELSLLLVSMGYLQVIRIEEFPHRTWLGLTEKGKKYVKRFEI